MDIKPIKTEEDYKQALAMLEVLIDADPDPDSEDGDKLSILSTLVENYEAVRYPVELPTPVEAIKFRMEQAGLQPVDLVPYIGSRSKVSEVLSEKRPLSLDMIRALEAGLGISAETLIQKRDAVDSPFQSWSDSLVREMNKRGYFKQLVFDGKNKVSLLADFFESKPPSAAQLAWRKTNPRVSARTDEFALLAWAQRLKNIARDIETTMPYKDGVINQAFMKEVIRLSVAIDGPLQAQAYLAKHGIVLIILEHLPKTRVDGVTILEDKHKPVIGLSLRYDRIDNFWFTLLHELAHIARHLNRGKPIIFDELDEGVGIIKSDEEIEADELAQEAVIPASKWAISPARMIPSPMAAQSLANEMGIHVAVVAGYIRHKHQNYIYLKKIVNNDGTKVRQLFKGQLEGKEL